MKVNVENIKVLKVENNGEVIVFKSDDIVSLEYKSVSIKGRIAQITDSSITVDCSTMFNSQIHEVNINKIEMIVKESAFNKQREDKITTAPASSIELEECEIKDVQNSEESKGRNNEELEPILLPKQKTSASNVNTNEVENNREKEELDDSVSLFGSIKRNYAQGISPIFNK